MAKSKNAKSRRGSRQAARDEGEGEKAASAAQAARAGVPEANVPPTTQSGVLTATGQAVRTALGQETEIKGKDRGAPAHPGQKEAKADYIKGAKPQGLQAEDAIFSSNGEIPLGMKASPSGLVPMAAASPEEQKKLVEDRKAEHERYVEARSRTRDKRISDATLDRLGAAELRAIAQQRGYDLPQGGNRTTRTAFAKAQENDENLGDEEI